MTLDSNDFPPLSMTKVAVGKKHQRNIPSPPIDKGSKELGQNGNENQTKFSGVLLNSSVDLKEKETQNMEITPPQTDVLSENDDTSVNSESVSFDSIVVEIEEKDQKIAIDEISNVEEAETEVNPELLNPKNASSDTKQDFTNSNSNSRQSLENVSSSWASLSVDNVESSADKNLYNGYTPPFGFEDSNTSTASSLLNRNQTRVRFDSAPNSLQPRLNVTAAPFIQPLNTSLYQNQSGFNNQPSNGYGSNSASLFSPTGNSMNRFNNPINSNVRGSFNAPMQPNYYSNITQSSTNTSTSTIAPLTSLTCFLVQFTSGRTDTYYAPPELVHHYMLKRQHEKKNAPARSNTSTPIKEEASISSSEKEENTGELGSSLSSLVGDDADSEDKVIRVGDYVVVEADRGEDLGRVIMDEIHVALPRRHSMPHPSFSSNNNFGAQDDMFGMGSNGNQVNSQSNTALPTAGAMSASFPKKIYRIANRAEIESLVAKVRDEMNAVTVGQYKVQEWKLPMVILDAEYQWDRRKLTFFFSVTLPQFYPNQPTPRIDFRTLVRDLYQIYRTRIWMYCVDKDKHRLGASATTSGGMLNGSAGQGQSNTILNSRMHHREKFAKQLQKDTALLRENDVEVSDDKSSFANQYHDGSYVPHDFNNQFQHYKPSQHFAAPQMGYNSIDPTLYANMGHAGVGQHSTIHRNNLHGMATSNSSNSLSNALLFYGAGNNSNSMGMRGLDDQTSSGIHSRRSSVQTYLSGCDDECSNVSSHNLINTHISPSVIGSSVPFGDEDDFDAFDPHDRRGSILSSAFNTRRPSSAPLDALESSFLKDSIPVTSSSACVSPTRMSTEWDMNEVLKPSSAVGDSAVGSSFTSAASSLRNLSGSVEPTSFDLNEESDGSDEVVSLEINSDRLNNVINDLDNNLTNSFGTLDIKSKESNN